MNFFILRDHGVLTLVWCKINQTFVGAFDECSFYSFVLMNDELNLVVMEICEFYNITTDELKENDEEDELITVYGGQSVILLSCSFTNISSKGNGGVLHSLANLTHLINCSFRNSYSFDPGCGGAVFAESTNLTVEFCSFTNCSGFRGGAVYCLETGCVYSFMSCLFSSCKSSAEGGAVYGRFVRTDLIAFANCIFEVCFRYFFFFFFTFFFFLNIFFFFFLCLG
jgi:hypothetical protein